MGMLTTRVYVQVTMVTFWFNLMFDLLLAE